ncbi:DNA phosphorothioation-associated putative methyltransferase, partial [Oleiphilus sp. HI0117]
AFLTQVKSIEIGKHLPEAIYFHKDSFDTIDGVLRDFLIRISTAIKLTTDEWNVVKLYKRSFRISFLNYPSFFDEAYPSLHTSNTVNLVEKSVKESKYTTSDNPPILHRKELFITEDHPRYEECCHITQEGEAAGLYDNTHIIGFKSSWERLIEQKGYTLVDGRLFRQAVVTLQETDNNKVIDRHKTAIARNELSVPMRNLAKHGYLDGEYSVFDYGCGRGDDLRELEAHGIDAVGWDPNFRPETDKFNCDLVNIGYVINVIEDREERIDALSNAFALADKLLVVSAMLGSESFIRRFKPYKDGVITSINTFQKYYSQGELQTFIEQTLDENAIPVAPGIFFIFKDKIEEQLFLEKRQRRTHHWKQLSSRPQVKLDKFELVLEKNRELFENFWQQCLSLGRLPAAEEFEQSPKLKELIGSHKKVFNLLQKRFDTTDFEKSQVERTQDLSVYFALSFFGKRKPYTQLPKELQLDVKALFGSYNDARDVGKFLLFNIAKTEEIEAACQKTIHQIPAAHLIPSKSLTFHKKFLNDLPVLLRVYVGCAMQLYGELDEIDLIKIHIRSGKCSFMGYDDFSSSPTPPLRERIKVKLADQDVDFFDYVENFQPPPLFGKSKLIDDSFSDYKKQSGFDKKLLSILQQPLPKTAPELKKLLNSKGYQIRGYRFYKV